MKLKIKTLCLLVGINFAAGAETFEETISVYGIIKPAKMTNLIAVNNGMINKVHKKVGEKINFGQVAVSAIERETTRGYRTTINGHVAKLHVTEGAAVTPGMPLVTIIDPNAKLIEVSLSPKEAQTIKVGSRVYEGSNNKAFGEVESVSPLVDPDTGGVISYVRPSQKVEELIGDIKPLKIVSRSIDDCKIVELNEIDEHLKEFEVKATSGNQACLVPKEKISKE